MKAIPTTLSGVLIIEPKVFGDDRGYFYESYNAFLFEQMSGSAPNFVQDNHSRSVRGVLRGLHYQLPPKAQGKLVRVTQGSVFDVAVDLRKSSPTFGRWIGVELSADNKRQLWVPPGFAHGFQTLSETAEFLYKVTDYYSPDHERCIRWDDPDIGVRWALPDMPQLSAKDGAGKSLLEAEVFS